MASKILKHVIESSQQVSFKYEHTIKNISQQRFYSCMFIMYNDNNLTDDELEFGFQRLSGEFIGLKWFYILHDKEEDIKPQYHIILSIPSNFRTMLSWAIIEEALTRYVPNNYFIDPNKAITQYLESAIIYCVHKDNNGNYLYDPSEFHTNFPETIETSLGGTGEYEKIRELQKLARKVKNEREFVNELSFYGFEYYRIYKQWNKVIQPLIFEY